MAKTGAASKRTQKLRAKVTLKGKTNVQLDSLEEAAKSILSDEIRNECASWTCVHSWTRVSGGTAGSCKIAFILRFGVNERDNDSVMGTVASVFVQECK